MNEAKKVETIPELTLGDRLAKARRLTGLTQGQFATEIGIARNSVVAYERDAARPRKVVITAWALRTGVPFEWLDKGVMPPRDTDAGTSLKRSRPAPRREAA